MWSRWFINLAEALSPETRNVRISSKLLLKSIFWGICLWQVSFSVWFLIRQIICNATMEFFSKKYLNFFYLQRCITCIDWYQVYLILLFIIIKKLLLILLKNLPCRKTKYTCCILKIHCECYKTSHNNLCIVASQTIVF